MKYKNPPNIYLASWAGLAITTNTYAIILISFIYFFINQYIPFNQDVSWLIHVAKSWLNNGTYIKDYFETNPPLAFYIYLPAVFISMLFNITTKTAFSIYYLIIAITSLLLVLKCLITFNLNKTQQLKIISYIAIWFFIIPLYHFGQRDLLSCILVTPHILFCFLNIKQKYNFNNYQKYLLIFMAIVGYMIKPQFIIVWLCLFFSKFIISRSLTGSLKETHAKKIFISGIIYLIFVYIFNNKYYNVALPLIFKTYYSSIEPHRLYLIFADPNYVFRSCLLFICTFIFSLIIKSNKQPLYMATGVVAVGYTLSYLIQGIGFNYHVIPALFGISLAILSISICELEKSKIFIITLIISFIISITNFYSNIIFSKNVAQNIHQKQQLLAKLPSHSKVKVLTCDPNSTNSLPPNINYASSFPSLFLPCAAFNNKKNNSLEIYKSLLIKDLINNKAEFILITNKDKPATAQLERTFFNSIYQDNKFFNIWLIYHRYKVKGSYSLYEINQSLHD